MKKEETVHQFRLDQIALDIEFLLISVIQGVALATLASAAMIPITTLQIQTWPYVFTAFLFILIFWSGAIIHAVSFIDWPIDLTHSFLYFLASLVEIMAITNLSSPRLWFLFMFLFQIIALVLYLYDLFMITKQEKKMTRNPKRRKLYEHILSEQRKELWAFIPSSLLFNAIATLALTVYPQIFIQGGYHLVFILFQLLFALVFLKQQTKTFQKRSKLLLEV